MPPLGHQIDNGSAVRVRRSRNGETGQRDLLPVIQGVAKRGCLFPAFGHDLALTQQPVHVDTARG